MSKNLNNDQRIKLGHKDVKGLGTLASTILVIELQQLIEQRVKELQRIESGIRVNPFVSNQAVVQVLETFINPINN
jgi:ribosomal protein S13